MMLKQYEQYLIEQNKSSNTIKTYLRNVQVFFDWLQDRYKENEPATQITSLDLREYQKYLIKKKYAATGIQQRMISIISYCKFIYSQGYIPNDIVENFKLIKIQNMNTAPTIPTTVEMNRFRREVYKAYNLRDIAIIEMLINTGIRANELISLQIDDIELSKKKGLVHIRAGKGMKARSIPLNSDVRNALSNYLESRIVLYRELWIGQRGPLTKDALNKIIKKYAKKIGLEDKFYPHAFRHYFATKLIREKKEDIITVANILGHSNLNTIQRYTQPTIDDITQVLEHLNT